MAEVTFPEVKDRNVATPSRVRLTKAVGIEGDDIFDVEPIPGSVYEEGTPLNKEFFDKLKFYIDNNMGSSDNPVPITNGGTGANTAEGARTNLGVYSKNEVDEELERASAKIEPHINTRVTDAPEGVHGVYFDAEGRQWFDPDGDGTFETKYPIDGESLDYGNYNGKTNILQIKSDIFIDDPSSTAGASEKKIATPKLVFDSYSMRREMLRVESTGQSPDIFAGKTLNFTNWVSNGRLNVGKGFTVEDDGLIISENCLMMIDCTAIFVNTSGVLYLQVVINGKVYDSFSYEYATKASKSFMVAIKENDKLALSLSKNSSAPSSAYVAISNLFIQGV